MAVPAMETYHGTFSFGHLLHVCGSSAAMPAYQYQTVEEYEGRHRQMASQIDWAAEAAAEALVAAEAQAAEARPAVRRGIALSDLADGPYHTIVSQLGPESLARVDAACRLTRELNRTYGGPWCKLGKRAFYGLELDRDSLFDEADGTPLPAGDVVCKSVRAPTSDWKSRYMRFQEEVKMFRSPFSGAEITAVEQADEIAYCQCKLRTDLLFDNMGMLGVYLEVEVRTNPDNVSLAVVDFEGGGCSSVTFSPDTGAVIRERKVREAPRKVEGTYIQPLTTITSGQGFEGSMGLYLLGGHLAFFRRHSAPRVDGEKGTEPAPWESTGFVTDLSWAEGRRLTPCLAFRDVGTYNVRLTCVDTVPPVATERTTSAYDESNWRSLDWDAGEQEPLEM